MEVLVWVALLLSLCTQTHAHAGSCEDHTPRCPQWAKEGRCRSNFNFMLLNCPVSCNACLDPECYDRSQRCSFLAARGNCRTQPSYMLSTCPHSCDNCRVGAPLGPTRLRPRTITSPDFVCGRGVSSPSTASVTNHRDSSNNNRGFSGGSLADVVNLRVGRQVIFPDNPDYIKFPVVSRTGNPGTRPQNRPPETIVPLTGTTPDQHSSVIMMMPGKVESASPMTTNGIQVGDTFCGATPITDRFLLTAAHCVLDPKRPVHTVRLGELDFARDNEANSRPVDYQVSQIIVHPDYKHTTVERYNDVALIQTVETIAFNDFVFPYCLSADHPAPKTLVTGAGFGFVNATFRSSRLQEAELELVGTTECEAIYRRENFEEQLRLRYPELLTGRDIICAAYPQRDACQGDSGGPLFLNRDNRRFLVGIVGTGVSCRGNGASILPGLYVSVADHIDFIDSVLYSNQ